MFTRNASPVRPGHRRSTRLLAAIVVASMVVPMFFGLGLFAGQSRQDAPAEGATGCAPFDVECDLG